MSVSEPGSSDDSDDLAGDIVGVTEYAAALPAKKDFLPWHRPRKQFVRNDQWAYYIGEILDEVKPADGTLSYFGLPGVDLLDLRYFSSKLCEPRSLKLRFLGFNDAANPSSGDQAELNISYDELSKSYPIDALSEILPDDFRQLANEGSIAWQKTLELGPYDVVNLDLCDGFGAKAPSRMDESYYNAVSRLLALQARKKTPWLMLLTTRVGRDHVHKKTLDELAKLYGDNLKKCADFQKASAGAFSIGDSGALQKARQNNRGIQKVFLVGLCKWLLGFSIRQNPPSKMAVKTVLGYRVLPEADIEDMVSIAIRFDPTHEPAADAARLASLRPVMPNECELATGALKRISSLVDVDAYLASATDVRDQMIDAMCSLLDAARYDQIEYRAWVKT